jgi:spore germination protein YaaH
VSPAEQVTLDFRTADPLQVYVAWLATPSSARATVGGSRPLAGADALVESAHASGGRLEPGHTAEAVVRWSAVRPGQRVSLHVPAGLASEGGSYLAQAFDAQVAVPASDPIALVQTSGDGPVAARGLKLQVYYVSTAGAFADLQRHARQIDVLSPTFYAVEAGGALSSAIDPAVLDTCRAAGVEVQPLVTNSGFDKDAAHGILSDPGSADRVAGALLDEARKRGYTGYQLDFENIASSDRDALTRFSATLGRALRGKGLKYSLAVIPRKHSAGGDLGDVLLGGLSAPYDYGPLGHDSDWLTLMAYDQHSRSSDPGPVAGLDWMRRVADATIPGLDRSRLYLGVPFYFRDWTVAGEIPTAGSYSLAVDTALANGAQLRWDFGAASAFLRYHAGDRDHVLWFEERAALQRRVALARDLSFAGISTWRLGFEDPAFWEMWPAR